MAAWDCSLFAVNSNTLITVDGSSSTNPQSQTISCTLHLDPADSVVEEQADACSCYDQSECEDECSAGTDNCSDNATCYDTDRSFLCTCNDGYSGDGIICDNMWSSVTYKSYDLICSVGGRNFRSWEKTHSKHRSTGAYNISVFRTHFFIWSLDKRSSRKTSKSF